MIVGIGNDVVEIGRFESFSENERFIEKYFTQKEIESGNQRGKRKNAFLAANFSVKESVSKVFGTGITGFSLIEIEVLRDDNGKPYVNLYGKAKEIADGLNIKKMHVSITDTDDLVITMAVGED
ncbi:MAG: holo-ACP synthase [Lachnospiraceae bacterium]|nr:holo-ACP synthase [Lachnospiraceae bacterium]